MSVNRITYLGYAAVAKGELDLVQPPLVLGKLPVRLLASIGCIYFVTSLILLQKGGIAKEHFLPILGILAAFAVFVYRTFTLVAGWAYRRHLRIYEQDGVVVFVPLALVQHVEGVYAKQEHQMPPDLFDEDLEKTNALVEIYNQEGFSPKLDKMLRKLMA